MRKTVILLITILTLLSCVSYGFTPEEMMKMKSKKEQVEFREYIDKAKKAAESWNFSEAEGYLQDAEGMADSEGKKKKVAEVKSILKRERNNYTAKMEREESASRTNSISGSSNIKTDTNKQVNWINVTVKRTTGFLGAYDQNYAESFSLSGGPGDVVKTANKYTVMINKRNGQIGGTYSWSAYYKEAYDGKNSYSGTVRISGSKNNVDITINGSSIYVNEY